MGKQLKIAFMGAFFLGLIVVVMWANANRPRIMILHSYSDDYVWTREINVGLNRVLADKSWIDIRRYFMETKKHSSKDYQRRVGINVRRVIANVEPDILIAVDDDAQRLAAKYFVNHPRIKIIFAGVNGSAKPYGYEGANNVTGIYERKPVRALVEMMATISAKTGIQGTPKAVFISDMSHSAERDNNYMITQDWAPVSYGGHKGFETFDAWQQYVLSAKQSGADFLLIGGYRKLYRNDVELNKDGKRKRFVPSREVATWTEANSPVPVIGMNVFNTEDGAMVSVGVSPYEQGETAANMALDIISGRKVIDDIPFQTSQQYVVSVRQSALDRRNVELPQVFEAFARTTNNYIP